MGWWRNSKRFGESSEVSCPRGHNLPMINQKLKLDLGLQDGTIRRGDSFHFRPVYWDNIQNLKVQSNLLQNCVLNKAESICFPLNNSAKSYPVVKPNCYIKILNYIKFIMYFELLIPLPHIFYISWYHLLCTLKSEAFIITLLWLCTFHFLQKDKLCPDLECWFHCMSSALFSIESRQFVY